jgi:hypothetical protein
LKYRLSRDVASVAACLQFISAAYCAIFYIRGSTAVGFVLMWAICMFGVMLAFAVADAFLL